MIYNFPHLQEQKKAMARLTASLLTSLSIMAVSYLICQDSLLDFVWIVLGLAVFATVSITLYFRYDRKGQVPRLVKLLYFPVNMAFAISPTLLSIATWICVFLIPLILIIPIIALFSAYIYYLPAAWVFKCSCVLTAILVSILGEQMYDRLFAPYINPEYSDFGKKIFKPAQSHIYVYLYAFWITISDQKSNEGVIVWLVAYFRLQTNTKGFKQTYQQISQEHRELFVRKDPNKI